MPATDPSQSDDKERDRDIERGQRTDRGGSKQDKSASLSASKSSKDLSHVPCKFFKVGGCTAGSSCPFSHSIVEPGGQKETCAWFIKGNCKFGHKCALAHILPGQTMAMDRKNKKAAQVAANAERGDKPEKLGKDGKGNRGSNAKRDGPAAGVGTSTGRNPLLAGGSTAPTRISSSVQTGRSPMPSMPLKATLTPSAPAPPLASFGVLDDLEGAGVQLSTAPAQVKQTSQDNIILSSSTERRLNNKESSESPDPLPASEPRPAATPKKPAHDFGPIGSLSPGTSPRGVNGITINPGTPDKTTNFSSSSPFSAPGTQSVFIPGNGGSGYNGSSGITASLGSGLAMMGGRRGWGNNNGNGGPESGVYTGMVPSSVQQHRVNGGNSRNDFDVGGAEYDDSTKRRSGLGIGIGKPVPGRTSTNDVAVEDEDLEDFLPSSLTDLLTPEERSRRMSRSNSGQGPATPLAIGSGGGGAAAAAAAGGFVGKDFGGSSPGGAGSGLGMGHRYSHSVPAQSLLGDIKSIWAENKANPLPSSPPTHRGTPSSSFMSRFDTSSGLGHAGDDMLSMSIGSAGAASGGMMSLSPSNASAAFLPGLHSQYLSSKAKQAQAQAQQLGLGGLGRGVRGTSNPLFSGTGPNHTNNYLLGGGGGAGSTLSGTSNSHLHTHTNPQTHAQHTYRATPSPFDLTQTQHHLLQPQQTSLTARPIPSNPSSNNNAPNQDEGAHLLSPGSRALQSHAPGQSLPQGLAAGYSRIHALPPPPSLASPGSANAFGAGTPPADSSAGIGIPSSGPYGGWKPPSAASPPTSSGLDSMFSRLSYSAATAIRGGGGVGGGGGVNGGVGIGTNTMNTTTTTTPPGLSRNVSGGKYPQQGPLSPLSGPVVTRDDDDDDLFSMDG